MAEVEALTTSHDVRTSKEQALPIDIVGLRDRINQRLVLSGIAQRVKTLYERTHTVENSRLVAKLVAEHNQCVVYNALNIELLHLEVRDIVVCSDKGERRKEKRRDGRSCIRK